MRVRESAVDVLRWDGLGGFDIKANATDAAANSDGVIDLCYSCLLVSSIENGSQVCPKASQVGMFKLTNRLVHPRPNLPHQCREVWETHAKQTRPEHRY